MADNVPITKGSGTEVAADEIGGVYYQRVKIGVGADGTAVDVSEAAPLPVSDAGASLTVDSAALGTTAEAEAAGNGGIIGILKKLRTLLAGGLPAALSAGGFLKVAVEAALPTGTNSIGKLKSIEEGLPSGTNELGKVKVTELPATPTGTNSIGKVKSIEEPLPAGTNALGKVTVTKVEEVAGEPKVKAIGDVASGSADSGNPVKTSGVAQTALPAATAAGNRVNNQSDKYGRQLTTIAPPDTRVSETVTLESETATQVLAAPGAEARLVVTAIKVVNAGSTSGRVEILDEATKKDVGFCLKEGGGWTIADPNGLFIVTANKPVKAKALATSKFDVFITAYKIPA